MARAADEYARLRAVSFGHRPAGRRLRSGRAAVGPAAIGGAAGSTLRGFFEAMAGRISWDQKAAIDVIAVNGALPAWFRQLRLGRPLRQEDEAERAALLAGLKALVRS